MNAATDELLLAIIRAGGDRWQSLLARAIAARLRRALANGAEAFEDCGGRLEDAILDAGCSLRAVAAARAGRGDLDDALTEAGESFVRLSVCLADLRCEALAAGAKGHVTKKPGHVCET
jgi:hypothetical protein